MKAKRFKFPAEFDEELFEILWRKDGKAERFADLSRSIVLRYVEWVPPYRQPVTAPTAQQLKAAEGLERALLEAERHLKSLIGSSVNDPPFLLNAMSRVLLTGQSQDEIRGIIGREPFTDKPTKAIAQFSAISSLLRSATNNIAGRYQGQGGRPKGRPAEQLALDVALGFLGILKETPTASPDSKFWQTVEYLIFTADKNAKDGKHLGGRFQKTLREAVSSAQNRFKFFHPEYLD
jgi:hypothetical protein